MEQKTVTCGGGGGGDGGENLVVAGGPLLEKEGAASLGGLTLNCTTTYVAPSRTTKTK